MKLTAPLSIACVLFASLPAFIMEGCGYNETQTTEKVSLKDTAVVPKKGKYGLPFAKYETEKGILKPSQNLSDILNQKGVPAETIHIINEHTKGVFDVRSMRVGQPYIYYMDNDSAHTLKYLVYEHTPTDYVVVDFEHDLRVTTGTNKGKSRIITLGIVTTTAKATHASYDCIRYIRLDH